MNSLAGQYDELIRCYNVLVDDLHLELAFRKIVSQQEDSINKYRDVVDECRRLKQKLDLVNKDMSVVVDKLSTARRWLDSERQMRKRIELEKDALIHHLDEVRRVLFNDPRQLLSDDAKEKLQFLHRVSSESSLNGGGCNGGRLHLNTIAESDSFSDMSFSRSADDLDDFPVLPVSKKHRTSFVADEPIASKKRKSSVDGHFISPPPPPFPDAIRTPVLEEMAAVTGGSAIKDSAVERINMRCHNFANKTFIMPESCSWCSKKIGFGRSVLKCLDCQTVAHVECHEKVPMPCVPSGMSPRKGNTGFISDYTPSTPPMVPAIVVHCAIEVERRGLKEIGIYRMSGTEAVVRGLREKFVKGKGVPNLTDVDIHSVCCFLKDFLRNLQDPLIPQSKRSAFSNALSEADKQERMNAIIQTLPQANRHTLAYLILHLQKVANAPECKMTASNLATVFGPTIVGYSNDNRMTALTDAHTSNAIMEELLLFPSSYWNSLLENKPAVLQPKTPLFGEPNTMKTPRRLMVGCTPGSKRKFFRSSPPL